MSYRTRNRNKAVRDSIYDRARRQAGVNDATVERLAETFAAGQLDPDRVAEIRQRLFPQPAATACPDCRSTEGHTGACVYRLAEQLEQQTWAGVVTE